MLPITKAHITKCTELLGGVPVGGELLCKMKDETGLQAGHTHKAHLSGASFQKNLQSMKKVKFNNPLYSNHSLLRKPCYHSGIKPSRTVRLLIIFGE